MALFRHRGVESFLASLASSIQTVLGGPTTHFAMATVVGPITDPVPETVTRCLPAFASGDHLQAQYIWAMQQHAEGCLDFQ